MRWVNVVLRGLVRAVTVAFGAFSSAGGEQPHQLPPSTALMRRRREYRP
ncbi:hypothetical protein [Nocardioides sp.]|nr:hypothetical protein [Nocardioides sp.]